MTTFDPTALLPNASEYQIEIFKHAHTQTLNKLNNQPVRSLVVSAAAGSGKTSTMVASAQAVESAVKTSRKRVGLSFKGLALAFNSAIAKDFKEKLPDWVEAKTLNSLGWGICHRHASDAMGRRLAFNEFNDKNKVTRIMRNLMSVQERKDYRDDVRFLVGMAKSLGIVPEGAEDCHPINGMTDDLATWKSIVRKFNKNIDAQVLPTVVGFVRKVLLEDIKEFVDKGICDFDDQKWLAVIYKPYGDYMNCAKFDYISVDECQDLNQVDIALVKRILKPEGYVMMVGDKNQSIYSFRGADIYSIPKIIDAFDAEELPLSISYRCATSIVEAAQNVYDHIEAAPNAKKGQVLKYKEYDADMFKPNDLILCRNNAPLISFAYKLILQKVPVVVKGRDIGSGLTILIDNLKATSVKALKIKLESWYQNQMNINMQDNGGELDLEMFQSIQDRFDCVWIFVQNASNDSVEALKTEINSLFGSDGDMKDMVVLSTVHKAKGLEADRVFLLDTHLMHPEYIKEGTWQSTQESNLEYVALTRAKSLLGFIYSNNLTQPKTEDE